MPVPPFRHRFRIIVIVVLGVVIGWGVHLCGGSQALGDDHFEQSAARFFSRYCVECHNDVDPQGGLDLTRGEGFRKGGDSGPLVSDTDGKQGLLWERLTADEMPPDSVPARPSPDELERLGEWLESGSTWPTGRVVSEFEVTTEHRAGRDWWSLQPIQPLSYDVAPTRWPTSRLDVEIQKSLQAANLSPSQPADRRTILRRLYLDLHGLPPTPEEIESFVEDSRPDAYQRRVDQLLASPRYGERWGRHWLDIARFGDTHGYERDFPRENAWRYRDYVINALNSDQPYDEFIRWQIAGDALAPQSPQALVASAFLACGPYDVTGLDETSSPVLRRMARADELDDVLATTISGTLGLTINCARCHNHKFDPITQADYYALAAMLDGIKREDRSVETPSQRAERLAHLEQLEQRLAPVRLELKQLRDSISLADIVGGGNGKGTGRREQGIDPRTGATTHGLVAGLDDIRVNQLARGSNRFVDAVLVPDGGQVDEGWVAIDSQGGKAKLPDTSGESWDYFQNGPVHSQAFTFLNDVDYATEEHTLLGMHANKLITFDLATIREFHEVIDLSFEGVVGYGGRDEAAAADVRILLDGQTVFEHLNLTRLAGPIAVNFEIPSDAKFLTLIATEGRGGISHDQVFFGDAVLRPLIDAEQSEQREFRIKQLMAQQQQLHEEMEQWENAFRVFGVTTVKPQPAYVHLRGDPESHGPQVVPATMAAFPGAAPVRLEPDSDDHQRRTALARWITAQDNALFARVIANRLWHYHFGTGLVDTPSDFGFYGGRPSHPQLLDQLAAELARYDWSLKRMHRELLETSTFQQSSQANPEAWRVDADNRLLWRFSPRRIQAESIRDSVLAVAGTLDYRMGGPGFRDFELEERYAPIYRYVDADRPSFWRRSIYRFSVRSVPNPFMEVLDCPNPSTVAPKRNQTTTALQALAMFNDPFMLNQAHLLSERLEHETSGESAAAVQLAFRLTLGRAPTADELDRATRVVDEHGLPAFCRALFNANEFLYLD